MIRNTDPLGRPPKAAPVFLIILYHKYLWIFLIHSLYIPYIFPRYVPYIFPCVFLNLWSQEKDKSLSQNHVLIFYFYEFYTFYNFISNCMLCHRHSYFLQQKLPIWAPTRTEPLPFLARVEAAAVLSSSSASSSSGLAST